jgi:hypothetical protein
MGPSEHEEERKSRKHGRKAKLDAAYSLAPVVSKPELRQLMSVLEPTERKKAELEYQLMVADPANAELVGLPLAFSGVLSKSVKVRIPSAITFEVTGSDTEFYFGVYNNRAPPGFLFMDDTGMSPDLGREVFPSFHLPMVTNTELNPVNPPTVEFVSLDLGNAGASTAGSLKTGTLGTTPTLVLPAGDPQISLFDTIGRVVAQEVRIYPTTKITQAQGVGTLFQTASNASRSLNDRKYDQLYEEAGLARENMPLANWIPGQCFRAVRIPQTQEDNNLSGTDWSARPSGAYPNEFGGVGSYWAVFFATGVSTGSTFRVEVDTIYEFANNAYAFATENVSSGGDLSTVLPLERHLPPHISDGEDAKERSHHAVASTQAEMLGPKSATAVIQHAANGSYDQPSESPIGEFGKELVSGLLDVGLGLLL